MDDFWKYFLMGAAFFAAVDFTTTGAVKNPVHYYSTYMPALLIFYLGYPLVFSVLIYKLKLRGIPLLFAASVCAFAVEVLFTHNPLLLTFPQVIVFAPVAVALYSFITFSPRWIVENTLRQSKWKFAALAAIYVVVSLFNL